MHATSFPPRPRRQVVMRIHGGHSRRAVTLPALLHRADADEPRPVDWASEIRLATVLSAIAVIVAVGLHGIVPATVIVVAMTSVAGLLAWRRLEPRPGRRSPADALHR